MSDDSYDHDWKISRPFVNKLTMDGWFSYEATTPHGIATAYSDPKLVSISFVYHGRVWRRSVKGAFTEAAIKRRITAFVREVVAKGGNQ